MSKTIMAETAPDAMALLGTFRTCNILAHSYADTKDVKVISERKNCLPKTLESNITGKNMDALMNLFFKSGNCSFLKNVVRDYVKSLEYIPVFSVSEVVFLQRKINFLFVKVRP